MIDLLRYWLTVIIICSLAFLLAYFVTGILSGHATGVRGRVPSLKFRIKKYTIHLHHWFASFLISLLLVKYYALFGVSEFLFLFGGSLGITIHGIKNYKDWKRIIVKEQDL